MGRGLEAMLAIGTSIIGLAIIAVLVSNNSNTSSVIGSIGTAFSQAVSAATSPITSGRVQN